LIGHKNWGLIIRRLGHHETQKLHFAVAAGVVYWFWNVGAQYSDSDTRHFGSSEFYLRHFVPVSRHQDFQEPDLVWSGFYFGFGFIFGRSDFATYASSCGCLIYDAA
jgi:hypothetical protein